MRERIAFTSLARTASAGVAQTDLDPDFRAQAYFIIAFHHLWTGDLPSVWAVIESFRKFADPKRPQQYSPLKFLEATYFWSIACPVASRKAAEEGLAVARKAGIHLWNHLLLGSRVYAAMTKGDLPLAKSYLDQLMVELDERSLLDYAHCHYLAAWHASVCSDVPAALTHIQVTLRSAMEAGTPFPEGWNRVAMAHVLMERGEFHAGVCRFECACAVSRDRVYL
jgi:hypothetical protein